MKLSLVTLYPRSLLVSSAWSKLAMQKDTSLERYPMLVPHCKVALPPMQVRPLKGRPHLTRSPHLCQFTPESSNSSPCRKTHSLLIEKPQFFKVSPNRVTVLSQINQITECLNEHDNTKWTRWTRNHLYLNRSYLCLNCFSSARDSRG